MFILKWSLSLLVFIFQFLYKTSLLVSGHQNAYLVIYLIKEGIKVMKTHILQENKKF